MANLSKCGQFKVIPFDGRWPGDSCRLSHIHAVKSHAPQGKTVDAVLSLPAVHKEQFYVSISHGRERCQFFTDDSDLLRSHITLNAVWNVASGVH